MNAEDCAQGFRSPDFHDVDDLDSIRKAIFDTGVAFISNCDEEQLVSLGRSLGHIVKPRNETDQGTGVSSIRCAPDLEGKGYTSQELFFHTDRSGWDLPPRILMTTLKKQSETGGLSLFVDTRSVVDELKLCNNSLYTLITRPDFSSFRADNKSFEPQPIYNESTGIFRYRFDDGIQMSASLVEQLPKLKSIFYKHAFVVKLQPGQCYIADNHRLLHGRTSFTGTRELLRVLAYPRSIQPKKFILFDVDGTLCRAEALSIDAYYRCVTDVSGREITHENTKVNLHGQTGVSILQDILRYHEVPEAEREEVVKFFFRLHPQYLRESLKKPDCNSVSCSQIQDALNWLVEEVNMMDGSAYVGLLTGNSRANALLKISAAGLPTDISNLSISSFGDENDSCTLLIREVMRKIEAKHGMPVDSSDIILIGDTPLDIECAQSTGCQVVAVATGNYEKQIFTSLNPVFVCEDLTQSKDVLSGVTKSEP